MFFFILVNVSGWHFRHRAARRPSTMMEKYVFRARRHGSLAESRMPDVLDHLNSDSVDMCFFFFSVPCWCLCFVFNFHVVSRSMTSCGWVSCVHVCLVNSLYLCWTLTNRKSEGCHRINVPLPHSRHTAAKMPHIDFGQKANARRTGWWIRNASAQLFYYCSLVQCNRLFHLSKQRWIRCTWK